MWLVLGAQNECKAHGAGTWDSSPGDARVLGCNVAYGSPVGSGNLGWPRVKLVAGPMGASREKVVGVGGGRLGRQFSRVSQCFAWGTGLPGAGICGTGRGDWVPARTPGETSNVSHTLW